MLNKVTSMNDREFSRQGAGMAFDDEKMVQAPGTGRKVRSEACAFVFIRGGRVPEANGGDYLS